MVEFKSMLHVESTNRRLIMPFLFPGRWPHPLTGRGSGGRGSMDSGEEVCSGQRINCRNSRDHFTVVWLWRCFVTRPAETFICIYSSWLTCHSPSSNVSIQGTIIYRIIDSQPPQGLPCQVTSQLLRVFSRGQNVLPTPLSTPSDVAFSASLSPVVPVLSAPWGDPEHTPRGRENRNTCPPTPGQPFRCVPTEMSPSPFLQMNPKTATTSPAPALHSDLS